MTSAAVPVDGLYLSRRCGLLSSEVFAMKPLQVAHHGLLGAVLVALLVGCATSTPGSSGSGAESSGSPVTSGSLDTSTPPIEGSGAEPARSPQPKQPSVELAKLPIGGADALGPGAGCVQVSWIWNDGMPKGVLRISVIDAAFNPPGTFKTGGHHCDNKCTEFSAKHTQCLWPVVRVQVVKEFTTVSLTLSGRVTCADQRTCTELATSAPQGAVQLSPQSEGVGSSPSTSVATSRGPNSGPSTRRG
jgi:hypothetical protein